MAVKIGLFPSIRYSLLVVVVLVSIKAMMLYTKVLINGIPCLRKILILLKRQWMLQKKAISSLTQEASSNADVFANEGKDRDWDEIGHFRESTKPAKNLAVVLNP
ncbi:hypothetical protein Pfo_010028 [Paulownia fortunei]|nr:hypothetical protein Pfo_010028 [Paulownia fortunei]